MNLLYEQFNV